MLQMQISQTFVKEEGDPEVIERTRIQSSGDYGESPKI